MYMRMFRCSDANLIDIPVHVENMDFNYYHVMKLNLVYYLIPCLPKSLYNGKLICVFFPSSRSSQQETSRLWKN